MLSLSLFTVGTFLGLSLVIFVLGRMMIDPGRNRVQEAFGDHRPLALGRLTEPFAGLLPIRQATREKLSSDLVCAGYHHRQAATEYLGLRNAAITAWLIFVASSLLLLEPPSGQVARMLPLGVAVLILIYGMPRIVLTSLANARMRRIHHALPDALDMITMAMAGGVPLQRALARAGSELAATHPDLACELTIVQHQAETGSLQQALKQLSERLPVPEVTTLAAVIQQTERLGGNAVGAFREFADAVRTARRQRADELGNKASVKMLLPVVLCLAPPVYILLLGPAALELRNFMTRESRAGGILIRDVGQANRPTSARQ